MKAKKRRRRKGEEEKWIVICGWSFIVDTQSTFTEGKKVPRYMLAIGFQSMVSLMDVARKSTPLRWLNFEYDRFNFYSLMRVWLRWRSLQTKLCQKSNEITWIFPFSLIWRKYSIEALSATINKDIYSI